MTLRDHDISNLDKQREIAMKYAAKRKAMMQSQFRLQAKVKTEVHSTHNLSPARTERKKDVSKRSNEDIDVA